MSKKIRIADRDIAYLLASRIKVDNSLKVQVSNPFRVAQYSIPIVTDDDPPKLDDENSVPKPFMRQDSFDALD